MRNSSFRTFRDPVSEEAPHASDRFSATSLTATSAPDDDIIAPQWLDIDIRLEKRDLVSSASSWLARGSAAGAILTMVLGPVGFIIGGVVGGVLTVVFGLMADAVRFRKSRRLADAQKDRLEQLLRWAEYVMLDVEDPTGIFVYVVLEFQGVVLMQNQNEFTRITVKRFREFLEKNVVQECAMSCVENFFRRWRLAEAREIAICQAIVQTCVTAFRDTKRKPAVYLRMEELLHRSQVKRLFSGATEENKEMQKQALKRKDWLIFADIEVKPQEVFRQDFARRFLRRKSSRLVKTSEPATAPMPSTLGSSITELDSTYAEEFGPTPFPVPEPGPKSQGGRHSVGESAQKSFSVERRPKRASPSFIAFSHTRNPPHPFFDPQTYESIGDQQKRRVSSGSSLERGYTTFARPTPPEEPAVSHAVTIGSAEPLEVPITISPTSGTITRRLEGEAGLTTLTQPSPEPSPPPPSPPTPSPASSSKHTPSPPSAAPTPHQLAPAPLEKETTIRERRSTSKERLSRDFISKSEHINGPVPRKKTSRRDEIQEKRMFESFEDLVNFQPELKHKVPIALYEFEFLDEFEPERSDDKSWDPVTIKESTRIYKKIVSVRGSDLVIIKAYATMPGIPAGVVLWNIRDTPRRTAWDPTFEGFALVEKNVFDNEIVYNSIRAPWPVASRDFLQWRRTIVDPQTKVIKILHRSAEHPGFPEPNGQSMIRAESIISAYIIRPTEGGNSCDLFLMTQTDIRGMIPRWIVNNTAGKAPYGWIEHLRKACRDSIQRMGLQPPPYNPKPLYDSGIKVAA